jgi:hypothetical protein
MLRLWLALGAGVAGLLVSGVIATMATAQQATVDPASVIAAFEMARNRHDVDAALAFFADDATISQRNTTFAGKDEIRRFLEGTSARSRFVVVSDRRATVNRVTWTERTGGPGAEGQIRPPTGFNGGSGFSGAFNISVEAIVQDGKIRSLIYAPANQPSRIDPSLEGRAQLPASIGLATVMLFLLTAFAVATQLTHPSATHPSTLRGRLLEDLQGWSAARQ